LSRNLYAGDVPVLKRTLKERLASGLSAKGLRKAHMV
jgi:hypothetical protein